MFELHCVCSWYVEK